MEKGKLPASEDQMMIRKPSEMVFETFIDPASGILTISGPP